MTTQRRWGGQQSTTARAAWAPRLPLPCCRCGKPVIPNPALPHDGWEVDHWPTPYEHGGRDTWPAHTDCNRSAGGRRGAQITNAQRTTTTSTRMPDEPTRRIRGYP